MRCLLQPDRCGCGPGFWMSVRGIKLPRASTFDFEQYDVRFTRSDKKEADVYLTIDDKQLKKGGITGSCAPG